MNLNSFHFILALSTLLSLLSLSAAIDWPRIRVKDGHLLFTVEKDKNISLITSGTGGIHVNGQDLAHVAKLASNLTSFIQNKGEIYIPDSPEGVKSNIYDQVTFLESGLQNLTLVAVKKPAIQRVNRRLNALRRRIRKLNILLIANECNSNPCQNGGTCQDLFDNFMCVCPPEWEGTSCQTDVNECTNFAGTDLGCQNGATCINKPGSYA
ncbi:cubilin-like [Onthophagus taurus]|uniref:cubilin-like n=1 Tax=Onthophagus taurus TaxID=166361 RepID=UPI0039BDF3A1